jgi:asparagine synthase (glutamine-hydrolysing)
MKIARSPASFQAQRQWGDAGREIFRLIQLAIWHRLFIKRPGVRPSPNEDPSDWTA